jgi:hypothetical protein
MNFSNRHFFATCRRIPRNFGDLPALLTESPRVGGTGQQMSRLATGILGAIALSLISGAAQFAMGRDLSPVTEGQAQIGEGSSALAPPAAALAVNRGAKGDRAASGSGSPAPTRTVSLKFDGFSDTTFLLRVPAAVGTPTAASPPATRKPMVACEAMVSVLSEVAKQLQPGRCVA